MALFPVFPTPLPPVPEAHTLCRPTPAGGCLKFLRYHRYTSNRLREFGPYDRFIDRAKLLVNLAYDDLVANSRYAVAYKVPLLGTVENERFDFQDMIFPFGGVKCPEPAPAAS